MIDSYRSLQYHHDCILMFGLLVESNISYYSHVKDSIPTILNNVCETLLKSNEFLDFSLASFDKMFVKYCNVVLNLRIAIICLHGVFQGYLGACSENLDGIRDICSLLHNTAFLLDDTIEMLKTYLFNSFKMALEINFMDDIIRQVRKELFDY